VDTVQRLCDDHLSWHMICPVYKLLHGTERYCIVENEWIYNGAEWYYHIFVKWVFHWIDISIV